MSPNNIMAGKRAVVDPINLIMGFVAILGGILIFFNRADYGLILLIISTLIEALMRVMK